MANIYEEISKSNAQGGGKPDANLANDANNLGGVPAEQYATHKYVQDYHNTKESAQKEYIDEQDAKTLQEAKEYTNSQIRNQDFSSFAKETDVQALDTKLSNKIEACSQQCASNLTTKIKEVVDDTNSNFQNVNKTIEQLNSNQNNLFQSVSSGKSKVAAAITDKGVNTASDASYDTMAGNIRNIQTGGESGPGFVNTSDANATASDILLGKTAYVQGEKVYGTLIAQPAEGYPTIGTDTSNATATADDIALGKTAYARGQLLTGTAITGSSDNGAIHTIEEIYGLNRENYVFKDSHSVSGTAPDGSSKISKVFRHAISKDGNYIVLIATDSTESNPSLKNFFIESFPMNDDGIYYMSSKSSTTDKTEFKKHRYTKEDLFLEENEEIKDVALGAPGFNGKDNQCLLFIRTTGGSNYGIHVYTYHLEENGVIGKAYTSERNVIEHLKSEFISGTAEATLYTHPTNWDIFYFIGSGGSSNSTKVFRCNLESAVSNGEITYSISLKEKLTLGIAYDERYKFSENGKYILSCSSSSASNNGITIILLNEYGEIIAYSYTCTSIQKASNYAQEMFNNSNKGILINENTLRIFYTNISSESGKMSTEIEKELNVNIENNVYNKISEELYITPDNTRLIALAYTKSGSYSFKNLKIVIFDISNIFEIEDGSDISPIQTYALSSTEYNFRTGIYFKLNGDGTLIRAFLSNEERQADNTTKFPIKTGITTSSQGDIIGIKYKNKFFYNMQPEALTASNSDVLNGKIFIGNTGYPQTGTMEVVSDEQ